MWVLTAGWLCDHDAVFLACLGVGCSILPSGTRAMNSASRCASWSRCYGSVVIFLLVVWGPVTLRLFTLVTTIIVSHLVV